MKRKYKHFIIRYFIKSTVNTFIASFLLGVFLAYLFIGYQNSNRPLYDSKELLGESNEAGRIYRNWLWDIFSYVSQPIDPDINRYTDTYKASNEADFLAKHVNVLCLILPVTNRGAHTVLQTWGRRCNSLRFISPTLKNDTIPIRKIHSKSSFHLLCQSFLQILKEESQIEWILIANEDSFAIVENLRYYVATMDSNVPRYLGHGMKFWNVEYNWIEGGIVLSKGTLKLLASKFSDSSQCEEGGKHWKNGDWYLGKHLNQLGVYPVDTRDNLGRGRFNGHPMIRMLFPGGVSIFDRYWKDSLYLSKDGPTCCSNYAVTFYGIRSKSKMYQLDYMYYRLRPFYSGGIYGNKAPNDTKKKYGDSFLTLNEKLKDEALKKMFGSLPSSNHLLTTPKGLNDLMKHDGSEYSD